MGEEDDFYTTHRLFYCDSIFFFPVSKLTTKLSQLSNFLLFGTSRCRTDCLHGGFLR